MGGEYFKKRNKSKNKNTPKSEGQEISKEKTNTPKGKSDPPKEKT
jgi:hypothetical protein